MPDDANHRYYETKELLYETLQGSSIRERQHKDVSGRDSDDEEQSVLSPFSSSSASSTLTMMLTRECLDIGLCLTQPVLSSSVD